jgi:hypothetical protein
MAVRTESMDIPIACFVPKKTKSAEFYAKFEQEKKDAEAYQASVNASEAERKCLVAIAVATKLLKETDYEEKLKLMKLNYVLANTDHNEENMYPAEIEFLLKFYNKSVPEELATELESLSKDYVDILHFNGELYTCPILNGYYPNYNSVSVFELLTKLETLLK